MSADSGVYGALMVLELSFTADALSRALDIPQSNTMVRRQLSTKLDKLFRPAR